MGREWAECDEEDFPNQYRLYEQALENALRGKKGQRFLREVETALLALPQHRLASHHLVEGEDVCLLGAWERWRLIAECNSDELALAELRRRVNEAMGLPAGVSAEHLETDELGGYTHSTGGKETQIEVVMGETSATINIAEAFGMQGILASHLAYRNDELDVFSPEQRWERMLRYVRSRIRPVETPVHAA